MFKETEKFKVTADQISGRLSISNLFYCISKPLTHKGKLNSHAIYLTLGQHCILHKVGYDLHHGLLNGFYHQMHPVDWKEMAGLYGRLYLLFINFQRQ